MLRWCLWLIVYLSFAIGIGCSPSNPITSNTIAEIKEMSPREIVVEEPYSARTWVSDNFIIHAELPGDLIDQLIQDLEHFRYSLLKLHKIEPRSVEPPLEIVFVKSPTEYISFYAGEASTAFYYKSILGRKIIVSPEGFWLDPDTLWNVMFHEYVHHFNASYLPYATPIWFNEGAAEYYATFRHVEENLFEYGHVKPHYLNMLSNQPENWPDMTVFLNQLTEYPVKLTRANTESAQERQAYFYALSWLLFHWSENTEAGQTAFSKMKQALELGTEVAAAFPQELDNILFDYAKSIENSSKSLESDLDKNKILDISFSELTSEGYAARLYMQLAFDPGSEFKRQTMLELGRTFNGSEEFKAYNLVTLSLLSLELGRLADVKKFILEAEETEPENVNLARLSAVIHAIIVSRPKFVHFRSRQEIEALNAMGRYAELNPGDIDIDFRVLSLKGRYMQSLGKNRLAAFNRIRKYEHHKRNPLLALYMIYPLMDEQAFDEAELILDRASLWNEDPALTKTISNMRLDLKYNRLAAQDIAD